MLVGFVVIGSVMFWCRDHEVWICGGLLPLGPSMDGMGLRRALP